MYRAELTASAGFAFPLVSLIVGPVTQQAVQTKSKLVESRSTKASVPICETGYNDIRPPYSAFLDDPSLSTEAAMFIGIVQPQPHAAVQPNCPTGSCSFQEEYTTLGVCSQCAGINDLLLVIDSNNGSKTQLSQCNAPPCSYSPPLLTDHPALIGLSETSNIVTSSSNPTLLHPSLANISGIVNFTLSKPWDRTRQTFLPSSAP